MTLGAAFMIRRAAKSDSEGILVCLRKAFTVALACAVLFLGTGAREGSGRHPDPPGELSPASPPAQREEGGAAGGGRVAPPPALNCTRDHLTCFTGRVLFHQRKSDRILLRMETDEATKESFTLRYRKTEDPARWFLLRGAPFEAKDWTRIESVPGRLREGMRLIVWVCDDGSNPVFDWRRWRSRWKSLPHPGNPHQAPSGGGAPPWALPLLAFSRAYSPAISPGGTWSTCRRCGRTAPP